MNCCSGMPSTMDLCGIAVIHSLWIIAFWGLVGEIGVQRIPAASQRSRWLLAVLFVVSLSLPVVFLSVWAGWISVLPAWSSQQILGATLATWIARLVMAGVSVQLIRLMSSLVCIAVLRRMEYSLPPRTWMPDDHETSTAQVRIVRSRWLTAPATIGWRRSIILVPQNCVDSLSIDQARILLAHELAHVRNRDYFWNLLQRAVEAIVFFHPVTWYLGRAIRFDREFACDDRVLATGINRMAYATTLASLEKHRSHAGFLIQSSNGAPLVQRIQRILERPQRRCSPLWRIVMLCVFAAISYGTACGMTNVVAAHESKSTSPALMNSISVLSDQDINWNTENCATFESQPSVQWFEVLSCPEGSTLRDEE